MECRPSRTHDKDMVTASPEAYLCFHLAEPDTEVITEPPAKVAKTSVAGGSPVPTPKMTETAAPSKPMLKAPTAPPPKVSSAASSSAASSSTSPVTLRLREMITPPVKKLRWQRKQRHPGRRFQKRHPHRSRARRHQRRRHPRHLRPSRLSRKPKRRPSLRDSWFTLSRKGPAKGAGKGCSECRGRPQAASRGAS